MASVVYRPMVCIEGSVENIDSNDEVQLRIAHMPPGGDPDNLPKLRLARVKIRRTGGTAATFTPRIFRATGAAVGDITEEFTGVATVVGTQFDAVPTDCHVRPDVNGLLYLVIGPNAGSDNDFNYVIWLEASR